MDWRRVRTATVDDADAIGRIHVEGWQVAYRGLVPDWYLDGLDKVARAERWREALADPGNPTTVLVIEEAGSVVGVSSVGPDRDRDDPSVGELWMIYLDPSSWSRGLGRQLMEASVEELRRLGYCEAVLWVLDKNARARRFYEIGGWSNDWAEKEDDRRGFVLREVRYGRRL